MYLLFENRLKRPCLTLEMPKRSEHPHNLEHCNEGNSCLSLHRVEKQKEKERGRTRGGRARARKAGKTHRPAENWFLKTTRALPGARLPDLWL